MAMEMNMDMNALPENCVAIALSLTSPRDACRLSLVSSTFRSASQSDVVWESFLPSDYLDIIGRSSANLDVIRSFQSKKQLFRFLVDDGKKSFWLDKRSGKKCYILAARDLNILWGDTPHYWHWIPLYKSRFPEVAWLLNVQRLEISRKIRTDMLSPNTSYVACLVYTIQAGLHGFDDQLAVGSYVINGEESKPFDDQLAVGSFGISGEESKPMFICLDPIATRERKYRTQPKKRFCRSHTQPALMEAHQLMLNSDVKAQCPVLRDDHWMEVELGEFLVQGTEAVELEMSFKKVKGGSRKSGLFVEGIEIRPKSFT